MKPTVLFIFPPIYDFALYDLYLKPYALLKLGRWFAEGGYRVKFLNCLDYRDPLSRQQLGKPRRKADGTGKFFRQPVVKPAVLESVPRYYARYGILEAVIRMKIREARPDLILISSGMTYWYPGLREAARLAKEIWPQVPLVVGGIYATLCPEHCRRHIPADYVLSGPAFPRLPGILAELSLPAISNPPATSLLPLPEVLGDAAVLRINQGCPYRCRYCSSYALSGGFYAGDPKLAFREVESIYLKLGTKIFAFYDDALLVAKEEVMVPFLERIIAAGYPLAFYLPNAIHLDFMDESLAALMFRAGFRELRIGFESSRSEFHTYMDNKLDLNTFGAKIGLLKKAGFPSRAISLYILAGLPGQEKEEVAESIRYAATFGVNVCLAEYSPIPGSPLWEQSVAASSLPLAAEPLTHNNSILPLAWKGFTLTDLRQLKELALQLCRFG